MVLNEDKLVAYVDGSYYHNKKTYGFGCILLRSNGSKEVECGSSNNPEAAKIRNVAGEIAGAMFAIDYAINQGFKRIEVFYDYNGIEMWATKKWRANNKFVKEYVDFINQCSKYIEIEFTKVKGHSNNIFNDMADEYANYAIENNVAMPKLKSPASIYQTKQKPMALFAKGGV